MGALAFGKRFHVYLHPITGLGPKRYPVVPPQHPRELRRLEVERLKTHLRSHPGRPASTPPNSRVAFDLLLVPIPFRREGLALAVEVLFEKVF